MKSFSVLVLALLVTTRAFGWGDLGHQTTAQIAESLLKTDPNVRRQLQDILGVEPLAVSATWPDHVRSDERFVDFAGYHFLTIFEDHTKHNEKDAAIVLKRFPELLKSKSAPREVKMIALRYLIHVVGDIHQPLHIGNEFDRGGNSCKVKWEPNPARKVNCTPQTYKFMSNLHSVWDTNLVTYVADQVEESLKTPVKYFGYKELSEALMAKYKKLLSSKQTVNPDAWVKESNDFLKTTLVYPDKLPANNRPYCNLESTDCAAVPSLDKAYVDKAVPIVEERLVLSGVRLAAMLKQIFGTTKPVGPTEQQVLEMMNLKNN